MKKPTNKPITRIFYLVATSAGYYGHGADLMEAASNARASTYKGRRLKKTMYDKPLIVSGWINHQTEDCQYQHIAEDAKRAHITLNGYEDGDYIPPFIGSWCQVVAWGTLQKLDMSKYPEVVLDK
jgi:hypothetical protein